MKKFCIYLFLLFLALILQFTFTGWYQKEIIDFFLIVVIFWSYFRGWREGVLAGFFCGLTKDIFFFPLIGINAFSFVLIGLLVSEIKVRTYQQNLAFFTPMVGALFLLNSFVLAIWLFFFYHLTFTYTFISSLYPSLICTCGLCGGIFFIEEKLTKSSISKL